MITLVNHYRGIQLEGLSEIMHQVKCQSDSVENDLKILCESSV